MPSLRDEEHSRRAAPRYRRCLGAAVLDAAIGIVPFRCSEPRCEGAALAETEPPTQPRNRGRSASKRGRTLSDGTP